MTTRPVQLYRPNDIHKLIERGWLDDELGAIVQSVTQRQQKREDDILKQVQAVYGLDAEIVRPRPPVLRTGPNTLLCGAEDGGIPTCGPAADCPHGGNHNA